MSLPIVFFFSTHESCRTVLINRYIARYGPADKYIYYCSIIIEVEHYTIYPNSIGKDVQFIWQTSHTHAYRNTVTGRKLTQLIALLCPLEQCLLAN